MPLLSRRASRLIVLIGGLVGAAAALRDRRPLPTEDVSALAAQPPPATPAPTSAPTPASDDAAPPSAPVAPEQAYPGLLSDTLAERNRALLAEMKQALSLDAAELERLNRVFSASNWIGQGNPAVTRHPMTRAECRAARAGSTRLRAGDPRCGSPNMVPLYAPALGEQPRDARVCIDQYEFPNIPCEYPIVWVRASEAVELCRALDKRICDAHEWEGACAGELLDASLEYAFGESRLMMEYLHNKTRDIVWAYGPTRDQSRCATGSKKSPRCDAPTWTDCGSNTYPAGAFVDCQSPFGVYDLHGNAAEHMNLAEKPEELASLGGLGQTEMKGSWFIFSTYQAHPDDCRWRAPMWHASGIDDPASHRNYHLGFRCCRDVAAGQSATGLRR